MDQTSVIPNQISDTPMRWLYDCMAGKMVFLLLSIVVIVIVDYRQLRSTKDKLLMHVLDEIDQNINRVDIATAGFNFEKMAPLEVRLTRAAVALNGERP